LELMGYLLKLGLITSVEYYKAALGRESRRDGFADTFAGSGDKYNLLFQSKVHRS
jgi:hypothetical protein